MRTKLIGLAGLAVLAFWMVACEEIERIGEGELAEETELQPTTPSAPSNGDPAEPTDPANPTDPADPNNPLNPETLPFSWGEVQWVSGDESVASWARTVHISSASVGSVVSWRYSKPPGNWARTGAINNSPNACIGWVTEVDGRWYGAIAEWLLPGQTQQAKKIFQSDRGNKKVFGSPLRDFVPSKGQTFYLFVCGLNWRGQKNVKERSNLVPVVYQ